MCLGAALRRSTTTPSRRWSRASEGLGAAIVAAGLAAAPERASADIALVVVNDAYRDLEDFDAGAVRGTLERGLALAGFEVIVVEDATTGGLLSALRRVSSRPDPGGAAIFYYVGYARQLRGRNFVIARNAAPSRPFDFVTQGIDLDSILKSMADAGGRAQIAVIDGAYPEPRLDGLPGLEPGLAETPAGARSAVVLGAPSGQILPGIGGADALAAAFGEALADPTLGLGQIIARFSSLAATRAGRRVDVALGSAADAPLMPPTVSATPVPAAPEQAAPEPAAPQPEPQPTAEPEETAPRAPGFVAAPRPDPTPAPDPAPAPSAAEALSAQDFEATLDEFDRRQIQLALRALGLYQLAIDGDFGPGTRRAIVTFQRLRGFEPTGLLTERQRAVLFEIAGL